MITCIFAPQTYSGTTPRSPSHWAAPWTSPSSPWTPRPVTSLSPVTVHHSTIPVQQTNGTMQVGPPTTWCTCGSIPTRSSWRPTSSCPGGSSLLTTLIARWGLTKTTANIDRTPSRHLNTTLLCLLWAQKIENNIQFPDPFAENLLCRLRPPLT